MRYPTIPELNYAMHLLASCFIELFPKLQLFDFELFPDRFHVHFSFSRTLSLEEMKMLKERFFLKIEKKEKGAIREMVSKNACDMLVHQRQFFLTQLIDKQEPFTPMFCMDLYSAPLTLEIEQEVSFKGFECLLMDKGEGKILGKKIHHYILEGFVFLSQDGKRCSMEQFHQKIGEEKGWFWIKEGSVAFSSKGEKEFDLLFSSCSDYFGEKIFLNMSPERFSVLSGFKDFYCHEISDGSFNGIEYGLKEGLFARMVCAFSFSGKDLLKKCIDFLKNLGLKGEMDKNSRVFVTDYKGIPWMVGEGEYSNGEFSLQMNLQTIYALLLEKTMQ